LTKIIAGANWLCHYLQVRIINERKFRDISFDVRGLCVCTIIIIINYYYNYS